MSDKNTALASFSRFVVALTLIGFSLYTALFGVFPDMIQRSVHLGLVLALVFLGALTASSVQPAQGTLGRTLAVILTCAGLVVTFYQVAFFNEIWRRYGLLTQPELYLGIGLTVILLEATRRTIGWPMVVLAVVSIVYAYFGKLLPGLIGNPGYSLERIVSQLYLGDGGIFGIPLGVSATFVIVIVIFGSVLEHSGAGTVLMDLAISLTGRSRGGPAKAAVVGSSLMGTISGTAVANVLTIGTITIPLMKRNGYRAETAGAIEAVASTGGQLMPPIMGAAAFLMADMTGIPYLKIAQAAILPALIYYVLLFAVVHLEAVKRNIPVLQGEEVPSFRGTLLRGGHLLLSLPVFVYLLVKGYSVMYTSFWAVVVALGLACIKRSTWPTPDRLLRMVNGGAEGIITVATACATAGIIIGMINLTGIGLKFASLVVMISGGHLFVALVLTMVASLILGMGLPTAAAYILVAVLTAPALIHLGVNKLAANLFVFYAAMLSAITPPVALAAYAAGAIARANPIKIAIGACRFGIAAFIVPFYFAYSPALIGVNATPMMMLQAGTTAIIGSVCLAVAVQGWCLRRINWIERVGFVAVAGLTLSVGLRTDFIGLGILALLLAYQVAGRKGWLRGGVA